MIIQILGTNLPESIAQTLSRVEPSKYPNPHAMHKTVREHLIDIARAKKTTSYSELVAVCRLSLDLSLDRDRAELGRILGDISNEEHAHGRPLISAVAVLSDTGFPSDGFYRLAETLGYGTAKQLERAYFGVKEMNKCSEFWRNPDNYRSFR